MTTELELFNLSSALYFNTMKNVYKLVSACTMHYNLQHFQGAYYSILDPDLSSHVVFLRIKEDKWTKEEKCLKFTSVDNTKATINCMCHLTDTSTD